MKIATQEEMRELDREAIEDRGIPGSLLMENAGRAVAEWILKTYPEKRKIYIFCGSGNNGGDGLVVVRLLTEHGKEVSVFELKSLRNWEAIKPKIKADDLIVDALFGTGLNRPLEGVAATLIRFMNASKAPTVSIDIPSGLSADTGKPLGIAVRADSTVTFQVAKQGFFLHEAAQFVGTLKIADIGIPRNIKAWKALNRHVVSRDDIHIRPRPLESHKGSFGHALVIGGELGKIGAGLLAAKAFMRAGGGLASFALPKESYKRVSKNFLELMYLPIQTGAPHLTPSAIDPITGELHRKSVCVLGPGLGHNEDTEALVTALIRKIKIPLVLDADGLNAIASHKELLTRHRGPLVLTPHPGEMARLTGLSTRDIAKNRIDIAINFAKTHRVHLVLKGHRTLTATPDGELYINLSGNPGMATAGMGDVLSGVIASLIAQGYPITRAVIYGVFIHGLAGDRVRDKKGEHGLMAHDVAEALPYVLKELGAQDD